MSRPLKNRDEASLSKKSSDTLRTTRSAAFRRNDIELVKRIDGILRRRANGERNYGNGPPFKPYEIDPRQPAVLRMLWERCNELEISRNQLARDAGFTTDVVYHLSRQDKYNISIVNLTALLNAVGLELTVRPATHGCGSRTSSEGS